MKKYVILSVNDNMDYLYYTPLTCWAWRQFGWEPVVFFQRSVLEHRIEQLVFNQNDEGERIFMLHVDGYRADTITQISRLYGSCIADSYLMTSDIDMIPLSDYWKPDFNKFTVWGHDLTGFKNYPICYIGGPANLWRQVMRIHSDDYNAHILRDLDSLPQAKSTDFYKYWETDQDLITKRLKDYGTSKIDFITRGQGKHGFARGRVDKGQGGWVLDHPELIDCHFLLQTWHSEEKVLKTIELLEKVWPNEDFQWFRNYTAEFRRLSK